ncbi:hypothetical protein Salat_2494600 [Sesamum alatum]|uniref:Uncharacterized protein n=1 Tax=Sesamum alatum TaxID=300844 RepID=A0AAE2CC58_9LAMI|nr:hypothetical protein Salat_2494600 [Sesamum alatum]
MDPSPPEPPSVSPNISFELASPASIMSAAITPPVSRPTSPHASPTLPPIPPLDPLIQDNSVSPSHPANLDNTYAKAHSPFPNPTQPQTPNQMYKQRLMSISQHAYFPTWLQEWEPLEKTTHHGMPDINTNLPQVTFSEIEAQRIQAKWRKILIVQTSGISRLIQDFELRLTRIRKSAEIARTGAVPPMDTSPHTLSATPSPSDPRADISSITSIVQLLNHSRPADVHMSPNEPPVSAKLNYRSSARDQAHGCNNDPQSSRTHQPTGQPESCHVESRATPKDPTCLLSPLSLPTSSTLPEIQK